MPNSGVGESPEALPVVIRIPRVSRRGRRRGRSRRLFGLFRFTTLAAMPLISLLVFLGWQYVGTMPKGEGRVLSPIRLVDRVDQAESRSRAWQRELTNSRRKFNGDALGRIARVESSTSHKPTTDTWTQVHKESPLDRLQEQWSPNTPEPAPGIVAIRIPRAAARTNHRLVAGFDDEDREARRLPVIRK